MPTMLISRDELTKYLVRAEMAAEVTLPADSFRDLVLQAMLSAAPTQEATAAPQEKPMRLFEEDEPWSADQDPALVEYARSQNGKQCTCLVSETMCDFCKAKVTAPEYNIPAPDATPKLPKTAEEKELERAKLHGPDTRTIDALEVATACARAAERDFVQVHRNCIAARERADDIERQRDALRDKLAEAEREIYYLRLYGNKDCTAQADAALRERGKA